jgi:hypothetical protein
MTSTRYIRLNVDLSLMGDDDGLIWDEEEE